jgi:hypothetical protein
MNIVVPHFNAPISQDVIYFGPFRLSSVEWLLEESGDPVQLGSRALDILQMEQATEAIAGLIAKSLIAIQTNHTGALYRLLDTTRAYVRTKVVDSARRMSLRLFRTERRWRRPTQMRPVFSRRADSARSRSRHALADLSDMQHRNERRTDLEQSSLGNWKCRRATQRRCLP